MWSREDVVAAMLLFAFGAIVTIVFAGWHP